MMTLRPVHVNELTVSVSSVKFGKPKAAASVAIALMLIATATYLAVVPRPGDGYFQLYLLGNKGQLGDYFVGGGNSPLPPGQMNNWTLVITNRFQSPQNVLVVVKLGDTSTTLPNSTSMTPSNAPTVTTFSTLVQPQANWTVPFVWSTVGTQASTNRSLFGVYVDGKPSEVYLSNFQAHQPLDLIFELWSSPASSNGTPKFGWVNGLGNQSAWLQVHFTVAPSS